MPDRSDLDQNISVILVRPQTPENIGLAARSMKNTGFRRLCLVLEGPLPGSTQITAVHAEDILSEASLFSQLSEAVADQDVVFAAVARHRKNFPSLTLSQAVEKILGYPRGTRIGLLYGNERTGLDSSELRHSNYRFSIPQAFVQPSYNLASAVLLTLFSLVFRERPQPVDPAVPLPRREFEACVHLILQKLEDRRFFHAGNRKHVSEMVFELFGRLGMTARDRDLLLAMFGKGPKNI